MEHGFAHVTLLATLTFLVQVEQHDVGEAKAKAFNGPPV